MTPVAGVVASGWVGRGLRKITREEGNKGGKAEIELGEMREGR